MNRQRQIIYSQRQRVLNGENLRDYIIEMARDIIGEFMQRNENHFVISTYSKSKTIIAQDTDFEPLNEFMQHTFFTPEYNVNIIQDIEINELIDDLHARC